MKITRNRLISYIIPYWKYALSGTVLNFLGTMFSLFSFAMAIPFLGILFNQQDIVHEPVPFEMSSEAIQHNFNYLLSKVIIEQGKGTALLVVSLVVVGFVLLKSTFNYLGSYMIVPLQNGTVRDIRNQLYSKTLQLPLSYYSEEKKGDILLRMSGDVQEVMNTIMRPLTRFMKAPIQVIVYLVALFYMNFELTLFVLALLPLSGYIIGMIGKNLKKKSSRGQREMGGLLSTIEETLYGLRIIKAFNSEGRASGKFHHQNKKYTRTMNKIFRRRVLARPLSESLSTMVVVIIMWYGGNQVLQNEAD